MNVSPQNPQPPTPEAPPTLSPQSAPTSAVPFSAFTKSEKRLIVAMAGMAGIFSPISSSIYFPAIPTIAKEFHTSISLINLTVTVYMIAQGISPVIFAPLADVYGRRPVFIACLSLLAASCIALAVIPTSAWWLLLILRMVQSSGSSSTIALGGGVISDIATPAERGVYLGATTLGPTLGPCLGPILGGVLAGQLGWRWIFWFLCILTGVCLIPMILFYPETLRFVVGDGSIPPPLWNRPLIPIIAPWHRGPSDDHSKPPSSAAKRPKMNPLLLFRNLDVLLILFSVGLASAVFVTVPAVISALFQDAYPYLTETKIGLCFLPIGIAGVISGFLSGKIADRTYKAERARYDASRNQHSGANSESALKEEEEWAGDQFAGFHVEKARLKLAFPHIAIMTASLIGFGWCLKAKVSLAGPLIFEFGLGWSGIAMINGYQLLLIDLYPRQGSSIIALNNVVRCTLGAVLVAVIDPILNAMGTGWAFVLFGLILGVFAPLMTWVVIWRGPRWRKARARKARGLAEAREPKTEEKGSPSS